MIKFIKDQPGVFITLLYLYMSIVGLLYQYFHLKCFETNILNYATSSDFLMAFGRAIPYVCALLILHALVLIKDILFNQRHAEGNTFRERCVYLISKTNGLEVLILAFCLPLFSAYVGHLNGKTLSNHKKILISSKVAEELNVPKESYLIETTDKYIFIFNNGKNFVVRRESLASFEVLH